ncbi:MAG: YybH family protein [Gemmatimonadota bacterium]
MRDRGHVASVLVFILLSTACAPSADRGERAGVAASEADVEAISALLERWDGALDDRDVEGLLSLYAGDPVAMPPNEPALIGAEAIRSWLQAFFEQGVLEADLWTDEIQVAGDLAYGWGTYGLTVTPGAGQPLTDSGKWVAIFQRQPDGSWKAARNMWNSDNSLPGVS